ncbi:MAG: hypothetical protein N6V41_01315, partial [Candidatus Portiera aleyrodidarum]|nr:hypothetical protein [Candidatus Portiera aleyrodidarum]
RRTTGRQVSCNSSNSNSGTKKKKKKRRTTTTTTTTTTDGQLQLQQVRTLAPTARWSAACKHRAAPAPFSS